jgi:hypothetical protein
MIEEFPFTTKFLQIEKDIHSLESLIAQAVRETKERLASQTWARLTWEQRITLHPYVMVSTLVTSKSKTVVYHVPLSTTDSTLVVCETLSQMQF